MFADVTRVESSSLPTTSATWSTFWITRPLSDGTFQAVIGNGGYDEWRVVDRFAVVADRAPRSWPYVVSAGTACGDVCWINGSTVIGFRDYIVY
jgi:hypothetical protein